MRSVRYWLPVVVALALVGGVAYSQGMAGPCVSGGICRVFQLIVSDTSASSITTSGGIAADGLINAKLEIANTGTSGGCSGVTGYVCVDDGFAVGNGSGTTQATISTAGVIDTNSTSETSIDSQGGITTGNGTFTCSVAGACSVASTLDAKGSLVNTGTAGACSGSNAAVCVNDVMEWASAGTTHSSMSAAGVFVVPVVNNATSIKNTGTAANCSSNTGAVCIDDAGGLAVTDGSGNTKAKISAAGVFTSEISSTNGRVGFGSGENAQIVCDGTMCYFQLWNASAYQKFLNYTITDSGATTRVGSGTGGADAFIGGTLTSITTAVGNTADTNEDDLQSYTLPASTLVATGRAVRITAMGTANNDADTKTLKVYFGTSMVTVALATNIAIHWRATARVIRTGASAQDYEVRVEVINTGTDAVSAIESAVGSLTETESGTITIKTTGQTTGGQANDIVAELTTVEIF